MNLSAMMYPGQYTQLHAYIKQLIYKNGSGFDLYIGACLNFNKLLGMNYLEKKSDLEGLNAPRIVQMLNTMDFIGISNYPNVSRCWRCCWGCCCCGGSGCW